MTSPYICTKTVRKIAANLGDVLKRESGLIVVGNALNDCSLEIDKLRSALLEITDGDCTCTQFVCLPCIARQALADGGGE